MGSVPYAYRSLDLAPFLVVFYSSIRTQANGSVSVPWKYLFLPEFDRQALLLASFSL